MELTSMLRLRDHQTIESPSVQFPMPKATFIVSAITIYYILLSFSAFVTFVKLSVNLPQSLRSNLQRWNLNIYSKNIYSHCYSKKLGDWSRTNKEQDPVRNNWCLLSINASLCNTFISKILRRIESTGTVSIGGTMFFKELKKKLK